MGRHLLFAPFCYVKEDVSPGKGRNEHIILYEIPTRGQEQAKVGENEAQQALGGCYRGYK